MCSLPHLFLNPPYQAMIIHQHLLILSNCLSAPICAGMSIFDTMRHIRPNVSTVTVGLAASMGAFIAATGTPGKRYALPNSRIMIHQVCFSIL